MLEPDPTLHTLYPLAPVVAGPEPVVVTLLQPVLLLLVLPLLGVPLGVLLLLQLLLAEERDVCCLEASRLFTLQHQNQRNLRKYSALQFIDVCFEVLSSVGVF